MSHNFSRPIRIRIGIDREEYLAGARSWFVVYLLACGMVAVNFSVPFSEEKFVSYTIPALAMLGIACVISHSRFLFWPENPSKGDYLPFIIIPAAGIPWFCENTFTFNQRILGHW